MVFKIRMSVKLTVVTIGKKKEGDFFPHENLRYHSLFYNAMKPFSGLVELIK